MLEVRVAVLYPVSLILQLHDFHEELSRCFPQSDDLTIIVLDHRL